jgi:hypothetical protein
MGAQQRGGGDANQRAELLAGFVAELRNLIGVFEIARACMRYAYHATQLGHEFSSTGVRGLDGYQEILRLITGDVSTVLTQDVVDSLAELVSSSSNSPLAAWCIADAVSVAVGQDFTAHMEAPDGASEYELQHLDAYFIYPEACRDLYGAGTAFSERAGVDRDHTNSTRVRGLALWVDDARGRARYRIIIDKVGGDAFNAGLRDGGLDIAVVQPNRHLEELNVAWLSEEGDDDHRFFGVAPRDPDLQKSFVLEGISKAKACGASVVLLPELITTKDHVAEFGQVWDGDRSAEQLAVVVAGSFHHEARDHTRRNTAYVYFRDFVKEVAARAHHKTGEFVFPMTEPALQALLKGDATKGPEAAETLSWTIGKNFREDVELEREVRLYPGTNFSTVVVICADFIDEGVQDILRRLHVSLVLICNMTPKCDGFINAATGFVQSGQTTTLMVNNPALWPTIRGDVEVEGAIACMPIRPRNQSTARASFTEEHPVLLFNTHQRAFRPAI